MKEQFSIQEIESAARKVFPAIVETILGYESDEADDYATEFCTRLIRELGGTSTPSSPKERHSYWPYGYVASFADEPRDSARVTSMADGLVRILGGGEPE